jgi:bifunctional DNase/RNase
MTHDLTKNLIQYMNGTLDRVVITELKDDTFYAVLYLTQGGEPVTWMPAFGCDCAGATGGLSRSM